ncbi:chloride channel protein [Gordonia sp. DT219]|uniref:chloride channel protein n=1 Tax=Gordonia sp. DT219 TaxID=3416658 RepID=UPI003CE7928F
MRATDLGDFRVDRRMLLIALIAMPVGALGAAAAWVLLRLIGLVTNLCFYGRFATDLVAPGGVAHPWYQILLIPVAGGLIVGVMARYGSEKIRGHGMPEAIESILTRGSVVEPKVAVLKPVSAAVSIGTGGPFGAEGPIIMTGGAVGSILAQHLHLTADERKTLLVAGSAAGMAATFNSPLAAILLAVELLLFEWSPRSLVPVCASVAVATIVRAPLLGSGPIFPVDTHGVVPTAGVDALAVVIGVSGALVAVVATWLVYRAEDGFARLPIHWMWWPAIGGLIIGAGGLIEPRALGVGYNVIDDLLTGRATTDLIVGILVVKTLIWSLSLGSGTSGGVLAPIFMIGGALGAAVGLVMPGVFPGFWALLGLAAVVGGVMRSPLTGVVFTLELTQAWSAALPVLIASATAYAISVLALRRSVLTEKIARRGLHLTRDYSTDPLETFFCRDIVHTDPDSIALAQSVPAECVLGPRDTLRHAAYVMAENQLDHVAIVDDDSVVGVVRLSDLLVARRHDLTEATVRDRTLRFMVGRNG